MWIRKGIWYGNSLSMVIPAPVRNLLGLSVSTNFIIELKGKKLLVTPVETPVEIKEFLERKGT